MHIGAVVDLEGLLAGLKSAQRAPIGSAAHQGAPIRGAELRSLAELENAIAAVIDLIDERRTPRRTK